MIFTSYISSLPNHWKGAIWKILACFFFAANNGVVKLLSQPSSTGVSLSSYQIAFLQNFSGFILMLPFILPKGAQKLKIVSPSIHLYRVLAAVIGVILWYMALSHMHIAQAVALSFTGPIFTVIASRFYLRERISFFRFLGIALGILGAFIVTRPDRVLWVSDNTVSWAIFLPLGSAIAFAISTVFARDLGKKGESAQNLTFYLLFFMAPVSLIPALAAWATPASEQWVWFIVLGILSASAHYCISNAYKTAQVTFLAPFGFTKLIFAAGIGFIAFAEVPNSLSLWIGTGVIIFGTFCLTLEEKTFLFPRLKSTL